jgi:hypothetical protein
MLALVLGVASAVVLFITELSTLSYRTIGIGGCESRVDPGVCTTSAGGAHSHVLWLIAVAVLLFSFGAGIGRSRPAAFALLACGVGVLVIAFALDQPDLSDLRGLDAQYTAVRAHTGKGFWLEIAGGVLAVAAGLAGLVRRPAARGPRAEAVGQTAEERAEARAARRRERSGG